MIPIERRNGKKVYYILGQAFTSDKGTRNGKEKAIKYCRENLLNEKNIIVFDSTLEYKRYMFLLEREKKGEIRDIQIHFNFSLLPEFTAKNGNHHQEMLYEADFFYFDILKNEFVVEDTKGFIEDVFYIKWKLFDYVWGKRKNLSLEVVKLRNGATLDHLQATSWCSLKEYSQDRLNRRINASIEKKKLRQELASKEKDERVLEKEKNRYLELKQKEKLTASEKKRFEELETRLKEKGVII